MSGAFLAFLSSFDEVVLALFMKSPSFYTLPVQLYRRMTDTIDPTVAAVATLELCIVVAGVRIALVLQSRRPSEGKPEADTAYAPPAAVSGDLEQFSMVNPLPAPRPNRIPRADDAEYAGRMDRALEAALKAGLDGLIVWGRSSTNSDGSQDLLYLTNHMSAVSHIPDSQAHRARGHAGLVLAPGHNPVLVADSFDSIALKYGARYSSVDLRRS